MNISKFIVDSMKAKFFFDIKEETLQLFNQVSKISRLSMADIFRNDPLVEG